MIAPASFNILCGALRHKAVLDILKECRAILLQHEKGKKELQAPFDFEVLRRACKAVGIPVDSVPNMSRTCEKFGVLTKELDRQANRTELTRDHDMDYYGKGWRTNTIHFYEENDLADYCVMSNEFFKENICGWIGDVRDVFLGVLNIETLSFQLLDYSNSTRPQKTTHAIPSSSARAGIRAAIA